MTSSSWTFRSVSTTATTNRNQRTEPGLAAFRGPRHAHQIRQILSIYQSLSKNLMKLP
jgi:hypothetical protein